MAFGGIYNVFIALFLWNCIKDAEKVKNRKVGYLFIVLFQMFAFFGDPTSLLTVLFPTVGIYSIRIIRERKIRNKESNFFVLTIMGFALSHIFRKIYYLFGAIPYDSIGNAKLIPFNKLTERLVLLKASLRFMYYKGCEVSGFYDIIFDIFLVTVLILIFFNILRVLFCEKYDLISTYLSLGIVMLSIVYVVTDLAMDEWGARYISYFPIAFSILIVRAIRNNRGILKRLIEKSVDLRQIVVICSLLFIVGSLMFRIFSWTDRIPDMLSVNSADAKLAYFLQDHDLNSGYGTYWHARINNLYTNGKVNVRQVRLNEEGQISPYYWLCKKEWYAEKAFFIIIDDEIMAEVAKKQFGTPIKKYNIKEAGGVKVYVYDKNLSDDIRL